LPQNLDDAQIQSRLVEHVPRKPSQKPAMPSMQYLHQELKRKHVTLQLLWYEYKQQNPDGYQYSYFCELYSQWVKKLDICLRQHHRAGEKAFIDYAGQTVPIIDPETATLQCDAQIFIATLGASNYTFAEASVSQSLPDWIASHIRAFEFFNGVPQILVPDNLKSGVTQDVLQKHGKTIGDYNSQYKIVTTNSYVITTSTAIKSENEVLAIQTELVETIEGEDAINPGYRKYKTILSSKTRGTKTLAEIISVYEPLRYWGYFESPFEERITALFISDFRGCEAYPQMHINIVGAHLIRGFNAKIRELDDSASHHRSTY
jgi:hypothetical protein